MLTLFFGRWLVLISSPELTVCYTATYRYIFLLLPWSVYSSHSVSQSPRVSPSHSCRYENKSYYMTRFLVTQYWDIMVFGWSGPFELSGHRYILAYTPAYSSLRKASHTYGLCETCPYLCPNMAAYEKHTGFEVAQPWAAVLGHKDGCG